MSNINQNPNNVQQPDTVKSLLQLVGIVVILDVTAFIAGISFFMIVHGTLLGIRWSAPYWKFSRDIFVKVTGFPETNILLSKKQAGWWSRISLLLRAATVITFLALGLWLLIQKGFCGQNLICLRNR